MVCVDPVSPTAGCRPVRHLNPKRTVGGDFFRSQGDSLHLVFETPRHDLGYPHASIGPPSSNNAIVCVYVKADSLHLQLPLKVSFHHIEWVYSLTCAQLEALLIAICTRGKHLIWYAHAPLCWLRRYTLRHTAKGHSPRLPDVSGIVVRRFHCVHRPCFCF